MSRLGITALAVTLLSVVACSDAAKTPTEARPTPHGPLASKQGTTSGRILYIVLNATGIQAYSMADNGTDSRQLTFPPSAPSGPTWSADGKQVLFSDFSVSPVGVWRMNGDGTGLTRLTGATG